MSSSTVQFKKLIGFALFGLALGIPKSWDLRSSSLLKTIEVLIRQSTSNLLMVSSSLSLASTNKTAMASPIADSTLELLTVADGSNLIPFPKDDKRLKRAPKDSALSPHHGLHKATLIQKTTVVEEIPGKICPVVTFTFRLDGHPDVVMADHVDIHLGQTIKLYLEDNDDDHRLLNWTLKSYSPTDVSRPGEIDFTIKLYPDGLNAKMLKALQVGTDHIYVAGPWKVKERLPASHTYLIAFGIGITDIFQVAKSLVKDGVPTTLIYANRYREDVCYREELEEMMQGETFFEVKYMYSRESEALSSNEVLGRLDSAQVVQQVLGLGPNRLDDTESSSSSSDAFPIRVLVIGSKPMMKQTWKYLEEMGYARDEYELLRVVSV